LFAPSQLPRTCFAETPPLIIVFEVDVGPGLGMAVFTSMHFSLKTCQICAQTSGALAGGAMVTRRTNTGLSPSSSSSCSRRLLVSSLTPLWYLGWENPPAVLKKALLATCLAPSKIPALDFAQDSVQVVRVRGL
jgi:hypothetical protein